MKKHYKKLFVSCRRKKWIDSFFFLIFFYLHEYLGFFYKSYLREKIQILSWFLIVCLSVVWLRIEIRGRCVSIISLFILSFGYVHSHLFLGTSKCTPLYTIENFSCTHSIFKYFLRKITFIIDFANKYSGYCSCLFFPLFSLNLFQTLTFSENLNNKSLYKSLKIYTINNSPFHFLHFQLKFKSFEGSILHDTYILNFLKNN